MTKQTMWLLLLLIVVTVFNAKAQDTILTLDEAIELARQNSLDAKIATNTIKFSYWNYKNYKSSFLPKLSLNGTVPNYFRSINRITLPSGENSFVYQDMANSNVNMNLSQNIGLTGGTVSMSSTLQRIDNFRSSSQMSYSSTPYLVSYYQRTIFYNDYKWQRKIEPLKYEEAKKDYQEHLENISYVTADKYFSLLIAQVQLKLARQNVQNLDTLLSITKTRVGKGTLDMNVLLQTRISFFNSKKALATAVLNLEIAKQDFVRYLKLNKNQNIELQSPDQIVEFEIDPDEALGYAQNNRKAIIEFQRRRIEAEQAIAKTKAETGPSVSLGMNFGLSQTGTNIVNAYSKPLSSQNLEVGFNIPILDWGVNKSNRKRAEANWELEKSNIEQQELAIEQEIFLQTMKWNMVIEQMAMVRETSSIAQEYYSIARQRYSFGTLSLTDFNNAQLEKDKAVMDYLNSLKNYWISYFLMRKLTLFDFISNKPIKVIDPQFK